MHFDEKSMWAFRFERHPAHEGVYMAATAVCEDASCPCAVVTMACREADPPPEAATAIPFVFALDLDTRKVTKSPGNEGRPESVEFGRSFVREVEDEEGSA